jgi:hypothetical protein
MTPLPAILSGAQLAGIGKEIRLSGKVRRDQEQARMQEIDTYEESVPETIGAVCDGSIRFSG